MTHSLSRRHFLRTCSMAALGTGMGGVGTYLAEPATTVREFRRGGMVYRRLGETDVYVSLLSFGSHTDPAYKRLVAGGAVLNEEGQSRGGLRKCHIHGPGVK